MRCRKCKKVNTHSVGGRRCWLKWMLCYKCALEEHPECYPNRMRSVRLI